MLPVRSLELLSLNNGRDSKEDFEELLVSSNVSSSLSGSPEFNVAIISLFPSTYKNNNVIK